MPVPIFVVPAVLPMPTAPPLAPVSSVRLPVPVVLTVPLAPPKVRAVLVNVFVL